jgi:Domain of unknown function (DUF4129)
VTDPRTRFARALLLAAASVVLVALVAVAAGGYRLGGSRSSSPSPYAVDTILTIVIALYIVLSVAVVIAMFWSGLALRRQPRQQSRRQRTWAAILVILGAAVLVTIATERFHLRIHPRPVVQSPALRNASIPGAQKKTAGVPAAHRAHIRLVPLFAVLGASGIAFTALLLAEKRRRRRLPREQNVAEALSDVLDETLDDLRAETDPRRAVIAAYARMERALAAHGVPRRRFEAPHEYLGRVLGELTGGRLAAARLTTLFERARFSPHEVDDAMKADAIDAIENLQADLAAVEAAEAA